MARAPRARIAAVVAVLGGAALFAFALPRAVDHADLAPYDAIVADLARAPGPTAGQVAAALANRQDAWRETAATEADIAALALHRAQALGVATPAGRAVLDEAIRVSRLALGAAPDRPFIWTGLAYALVARGTDPGAVGPAWRMAVRTAPADGALVVPRLALGYAARARLGASERALLDQQIRLAGREAPGELASFARRHFALGPVRAVLAAEPQARARFDQAYLSLK